MAKLLPSIKNCKLLLNKAQRYLKLGNEFLHYINRAFINVKELKEKSEMEEQFTKVSDYEPQSKKLCTENIENDLNNQKSKIRKRNVALLMAYNGSNYHGMQKNLDFKTIEQELLNALAKANLIPCEALDNLPLIHFQRAARTDKGVSAAKQVVSFKIAENFQVEKINMYLPEDIRVFSIKRVTKGFNCKNQCTARTYSYTLPTFALAPEFHEEYPKNYRIDKLTLQRINEILSQFLGTHPFHNFTSKKDGRDPSAKRYILSFEAEEPFLENEEEFITLKVKGQSFMLHQIRKMVGYTIAVLKGFASETIQTKIWTNEKISPPMAPGLGLVLEDVHYDKYNKKFGSDGMHHPLTWEEIYNELKEFRRKKILSNIIAAEIDSQQMFQWLQFMPKHKFEFTEDELEINNKKEESLDENSAVYS